MNETNQSLIKWNPWWAENQAIEKLKGLDRDAKQYLLKLVNLKQIKDILGVRRCGKTTLMYQIIDTLLKEGKKPLSIIFVKFDDVVIHSSTFAEIERAIDQVSNLKKYVFFDEIQEKKDWEKWVKNLYDLEKFEQIFLSGSNVSLLSKDLGKLLTGRHISLKLMPFSFKEYLKANSWSNFEENYLKKEETNLLLHLKEYVENGGFPETINKTTEEKKITLTEIYNDIISRDISLRHSVDAGKLKNLVYYLMTNSGREYSYRRISNILNIDVETAEKYIELICDAFLAFSISCFSFKLTTQFKQNKKLYCIDTGFANIAGFNFSKNIGVLYETAVAIELKRRNKEFYYWKDKTQNEVDFIVKEGLKIVQCIQVCYSVKDEETKKREIKSLLLACKEFNLNIGTIITNDFENEEIKENIKIKYLPLWKWLLER